MPTRRQVIQAGGLVGLGTLLPAATRAAGALAPVPGGTLDPTSIPKYVTPLFAIPAMAASDRSGGIDRYQIGARQFRQQVLPAGLPGTTVFGYGNANDGASFHWPSQTIEAQVNRPVRVTWMNQLVTSTGRFRPHLFAVDPTLHWANPPGGISGRDSRPTFTSTPGPYRGPVPLVTHLHGAHTHEDSDGYPEAWYLPLAWDIPNSYAKVGSFYDRFKDGARTRFGVNWAPGTATFQYVNDQRATSMWFHSHELGITRLNIYAGLAGFYTLRGGPGDLPAGVLPDPSRFEFALMMQDRSFNHDGSLFFPDNRPFFGDVPPGGPFIPETDVPPMWNPEFFGNTMVVNGNTWPVMRVEARRYRFRLLNACNTRVVMLKLVRNPLASRPASPALPMWVIGADGGFLPRPVSVGSLPIAVAERYDVIVDFSGLPEGTELFLINEGPDEPFGGGEPGTDFEPADPGTTGQVMKFVVGRCTSADASMPPASLSLPSLARLGAASTTRRLSLNEMASEFGFDAPVMGMLGTVNADGSANPLHWSDAVSEHPAVGATEIWELHNFTEDAHPIHVHLVQFQVVNRQPFGGQARGPQAFETGTKDTLVALPGEITRLKARFDRAGRFVWHCHIIDHEDNEMMRPYQIG
jgi:bilirubin oxidase